MRVSVMPDLHEGLAEKVDERGEEPEVGRGLTIRVRPLGILMSLTRCALRVRMRARTSRRLARSC